MNPIHKLSKRAGPVTAEIACQIVRDRAAGMSVKLCVEKHGINRVTIGRIANGYIYCEETLEVRKELRAKQCES